MSIDVSDHWHRYRMLNYNKARRYAQEVLNIERRKWATPEPAAYDEYVPPLVGDAPSPSSVTRTRSEQIMFEVCRKYRISRDALVGQLRAKNICKARHEAAFRLITETGCSYPAAGRRLGGRDHTTILHSVRKHISNDPVAAEAYRIFCDGIEADEQRLKAECIRLHFEEGRPVKWITKRYGVGRDRIMVWLLAEATGRGTAS
jgi:hypothetical protein